MTPFRYSFWDLSLTILGFILFLVDILLDVWAAWNFYNEGAYLCLGILVFLLLGSSFLAQIYSWLWYKYDNFVMRTKFEKNLSPNLKILHFFQLGIFIRNVSVLMKVKNYKQGGSLEGEVVYLNHDLAMLRMIETFSESAPQIVLMLTITLQQGQLDIITVLKTIGSMSAVALCVTSYQRSLRSFLPNAAEPSIVSSIFFFIWNWFLLISRLVTLSLFASVLPCFVFAHFFASWLVLFFFSWRAQTHFMDSAFGEWLYRATVGLIWYFDWFNVVEGNTRNRTFLYHTYILVDNSILLGVWFWMMITDPPYFVVPQLYAIIVAASVFAVYAIGLFFKVLYYKCFHPNVQKQELKGNTEQIQEFSDTVDSPSNMMMLRAFSHHTDGKEKDRPVQPAPCNKRMKMLAENFYS